MDTLDKITAQWAHERPDLDISSMGLIGRLKRINHHLSREMEKTFSAHGLNFASFDVLATLRRSGPPYALSPNDLLAAMMVTSGTMTNRIDQLSKAGLVQRVHNPNDRRSVNISLTEKGRKVIDSAMSDHVETQSRLTSGLSKEDIQKLNELLSQFLNSFEQHKD